MPRKETRRERRLKAIRRLDQIEIVEYQPCQALWIDMTGDDRVRYCPQCQLNVYNFAGMAADEICGTIEAHEGKLCAQFYVRSDGTAMFTPCPEPDRSLEFERGGLILEGWQQRQEE